MLEVSYLPPPAAPNRSGRFIATGVLLLLMATIWGCFTGLIPASYVMQVRQNGQMNGSAVAFSQQQIPPGSQNIRTSTMNGQTVFLYDRPIMPVEQLVSAVAMYGALTVGCGWLGIAALLKHRYVRPLVLVFGTQAILFGVFTCILVAAMIPLMMDSTNPSGSGGPGVMLIGIAAAVVGISLFFVLPPVILLILMKPEAVRETAERIDLRPRWTDGLPIRVLGLMLTLAMVAASELLVILHPRLPVLLFVLSGLPAAVLIFAHLLLMTWAAVSVYRRQIVGWHVGFWGVLAPVVLILISSLTLPSDRYLEMMQDQPGAAELIGKHELLVRSSWTLITAAVAVIYVAYMLRVRPLVELPAAQTATANTQ